MVNYKKIFAVSSIVILLIANVNAKNKQYILNKIYENDCENINVASGELGLNDLLILFNCNNPEIKAEYLNVEIAKSKQKQITAEYMPSLSINATSKSNYEKYESKESEDTSPYSASLSLDWLVYDFGGRKARNNMYKNNIEIENFNYNTKLYDTILLINTTYLNLLGAQEILKSAEQNERAFKKSFEDSSKKYSIGMVSLNDKLQAKTQYEQSTLEVIDAKNSIKQYSGDLAILLNLSPTTKFNLKKPKLNNNVIKLDIEDDVKEIIEKAIKNRSEIKSKESAVEYNKNNLKATKSELMPTVSAIGSVSHTDKWDKDSEYVNNRYIGVNISFPLFSGFSNVNKIAQAKFEHKQSQYLLEVEKNTIANEVWSSYQNYKNSIESYKISQQILESAEENLKVAIKSYSIGKIDIINLLTANSTLADARKDKITNFYNVLINKATLYRTMGEI